VEEEGMHLKAEGGKTTSEVDLA